MMLVGKYKDAFKIAFMALALGIMVFLESALAERTRSENSKRDGGGQKSRQVSKNSSDKQARPSSNDRKTTTNVAARSQVVKSRTQIGASKPSRQSSSVGKAAPNINVRSVISSSRTSSILPRSSSSISRPTGQSFTVGKQVSANTNNRINSRIISRIGGKIINRQSLATTVTKLPSTGVSSINPAKTNSIGSTVGRKSTSAGNTAKQQVISSSSHISPEKSERIISPIRKQRPTVTTVRKQPDTHSGSLLRSDNIQDNASSRSGHKASSAPTVSFRKNEARVNQPDASQSNHIKSDRTSRIGSVVGAKRPSVSNSRKHMGDSRPKHDSTPMAQSNSSGVFRSSKSNDKKPERIDESKREHKDTIRRVFDRLLPGSKLRKIVSNNLKASISTGGLRGASKMDITDKHRYGERRFSPRIYKERSQVVKHVHRHEHVYRDCYDRICHRIVWPKYHFVVYYNWGPCFTFRYVYPYYLRKYVFVSLGGYWPIEYSCVRYYWYGCHPYRWYGYYPIAREIRGNTYKYYTYNYYYNGTIIPSGTGQIAPVDHTTFADVREKMALQAAQEPSLPTLADTFFDEGVSAFEAGDYDTAVEKFARATELVSDDMILPFAYSQALFANEQYSEAAEVLRAALAKVCPEKEGVFYPRGLYSDDEVLFEQIDHLKEMAESFSFDADLQLLLGYQLLGVGEIDQVVEPLLRASEDLENAAAANVLLELLEKIKVGDSESQNAIQ